MSARRDIYAETQGGRRVWRLSTGLLLIAVIFAALGAIPSVMLLISPAPLVYLNVPLPVLESVVHPGDTVPLVVSRCTQQPFIFDDVNIGYIVIRDLRNVGTNARILLPQIATSMKANSCEYNVVSFLHAVPEGTPDGRYYFEGVAHVSSRWRMMDVPWHTQEFDVVKKECC